MKKMVLFLFLLSGCISAVHAQQLKRCAVGKSGCSVAFYCDPGKFESTISKDSSVVYSGECVSGDVTYELICVKLVKKAPGPDVASQVLLQYLDYLKGAYEVASAAGYKGLTLKKSANTQGISDLWRDKDNNFMSVRGFTNGRYLAVLMTISPAQLTAGVTDPFLESIVFPEK